MIVMIYRQLTHQFRSSAIASSSFLARRYLSFSFTGPKKLSDILQLEKFTDKSKNEIQILWNEYHATKVSEQKHRYGYSYESQHPYRIFGRTKHRRIAAAFRFRPKRAARFWTEPANGKYVVAS
jgi:ATP11 protein